MEEVVGGVAILSVFLIIGIIVAIFSLGLYLFTSFVYKKIFEKDDRNGLYGFIPIYRDFVLVEMGDMNWYWFLAMYAPVVVGLFLAMIPFVGSLATSFLSIVALVAKINVYYNLSKKFKTEDWFIVLLVLLPLIGLAVLAFSSKYEYHKDVEVQPDGFCGDLGLIKKEEPTVQKSESTKVTKEEIKETKKEEVKEAVEEEPKKTSKKKTTKKKED